MVGLGHDHPVLLRGASWGEPAIGPAILERTDQAFIPALLDGLTTAEGRAALMVGRPRAIDEHGGRRLFQPVHRTFHVALLEVACAPFDVPALQTRLDPPRIESAGLVVRRLGPPPERGSNAVAGAPGWPATNGHRPLAVEGWRQAGAALRGWVPFANAAEADQDPEPDRRRPLPGAGNVVLDQVLATRLGTAEPLAERVSALFVAPPEVCAAAGRTLLYGLVPVTSPEFSEAPDGEAFSIAFVRDHLSPFLRPSERALPLPRADGTLTPAMADEEAMKGYVALLRQLALEFGAFAESAEGRALVAALNTIALPFAGHQTRPAGEELRKAALVLIDRQPEAAVTMPAAWPAIAAGEAEAIASAAKAALDARGALVRPRQGRFDEPGRQYVARAFVRVAREDGCPPLTIWSAYGEPFTIAPWYATNEASRVPPARVPLPDPFDLAALRQMKPSVSFDVPDGLFKFLGGANLDDLMDGKQPSRGGPVLDWICAFSIPIITLCAFIVLNIFLQLLNFVFRWLLFVKICIPFPRSR